MMGEGEDSLHRAFLIILSPSLARSDYLWETYRLEASCSKTFLVRTAEIMVEEVIALEEVNCESIHSLDFCSDINTP